MRPEPLVLRSGNGFHTGAVPAAIVAQSRTRPPDRDEGSTSGAAFPRIASGASDQAASHDGQAEPYQELRPQQAGVIAYDAIHLDPITRPEIAEMHGVQG